jgi:hypothetical protein
VARTSTSETLGIRIVGIGAVAIGVAFSAIGIASFGPRPEGTHDVRHLVVVGLYLIVAGTGTTALRRSFAIMLMTPLIAAAGILVIGSIIKVPWPATVSGIVAGASLCIPALLIFRRRSLLR